MSLLILNGVRRQGLFMGTGGDGVREQPDIRGQ